MKLVPESISKATEQWRDNMRIKDIVKEGTFDDFDMKDYGKEMDDDERDMGKSFDKDPNIRPNLEKLLTPRWR